MNWMHVVLVAVGGASGAVLRYLITTALPAGSLPWGTLLVNVLGSAAIGAFLARMPAGSAGQAVWVVGFCGGFTTFSAFSWQLLEQLRTGQIGGALLHVGLAVGSCVVATTVAWRLMRS